MPTPSSTHYDSNKFKRYLEVQHNGQYNMITEAKEASKAANLSLEEY